jgi:hypothetical protein
MFNWTKVPAMNIPTDSTVPADDAGLDNYVPHLPQESINTDDDSRDLITEEAQTDNPSELLQVPPEELGSELDKQIIEDGSSRPTQDYEDTEDYTTMIENQDLNSDDPDSNNR